MKRPDAVECCLAYEADGGRRRSCRFRARHGERALERKTWWGEAPAQLYDFDGAAGYIGPTNAATPICSPSRGLSCEQGAVRRADNANDHFSEI